MRKSVAVLIGCLLAGSLVALLLVAPFLSNGTDEARGLNTGAMRKFTLFAVPKPVAQIGFFDRFGAEVTLEAFKGRVVLVNLWATWCVPCRVEMPSLDRLQEKLKGEDFTVVAISQDRGGLEVVESFLAEIGVKNLAIYYDPSMKSARGFGAVGLPVSFLVDREGREVGRLIGPAEWDSDDAVRLIRHFLGAGRQTPAARPRGQGPSAEG
jgi:thiol-disulfide isomerase/thioredoxin